VEQAEDAIGGADIALCAPNSIDNVFFERWIEPGMRVSSIKITEIELAAIRRADRLVLHTHDDKPLHVTTKGLDVAEKDDNKGWALGKRHQLCPNPDVGRGHCGPRAGATR
jgi:ornithine cyclodeaminase/alanine dehydrogenase-like protein (mu-crystallin family)